MTLEILARRIRSGIARSLVHRGLSGTLLHYSVYPLRKLADLAYRLSPGHRRREAHRLLVGQDYDRACCVDTGGMIDPASLQVVGANRDHGHAYLGIYPHHFRDLIGLLPIDHQDYVFVDFGSGKGRALFLASEWPFKAIFGIEFAPELHAVAEANLRTFRNPARRCGEIRPLCMDAVDFELPDEPAVLYFFNPFGERVLAALLEKVGRSLAAAPRDIWAAYQNPHAHRPLDESPFFELFAATPGRRIYRSRTPRGFR